MKDFLITSLTIQIYLLGFINYKTYKKIETIEKQNKDLIIKVDSLIKTTKN